MAEWNPDNPQEYWARVPENCLPKHYLFMSVDAIGSTRLKTLLLEQQPEKPSSPRAWVAMLLDFLPEARNNFAQHFAEFKKKCIAAKEAKSENEEKWQCDCNRCAAPVAWKYMGDEVLLKAELHCPRQAYLYLWCFRKFLSALNARSLEYFSLHQADKKSSLGAPPLQFKGCAWVAGFPVTNVEVLLPVDLIAQSHNEPWPDKIGPSIDLGFRLSKYASRSRIIISASLAKFLNDIPQKDHYCGALAIYSSGYIEVKGVRDGKHPLFWLLSQDIEPIEAILMQSLDTKKLKEFFDRYFYPRNTPFIWSRDYADGDYIAAHQQAILELSVVDRTVYHIPEDSDEPQKNEIDLASILNETKTLAKNGLV